MVNDVANPVINATLKKSFCRRVILRNISTFGRDGIRHVKMNIFNFKDQLVGDYAEYIASFINLRDDRIRAYIDSKLACFGP